MTILKTLKTQPCFKDLRWSSEVFLRYYEMWRKTSESLVIFNNLLNFNPGSSNIIHSRFYLMMLLCQLRDTNRKSNLLKGFMLQNVKNHYHGQLLLSDKSRGIKYRLFVICS